MTSPVDQQRLAALREANRIRTVRARMRRSMKQMTIVNSRRHAASIVEKPRDHLRTLPVGDLITWTHRGGPELVRRIVRATGVDAHAELGALTSEQRMDVADALREAADQTERWRARARRHMTKLGEGTHR